MGRVSKVAAIVIRGSIQAKLAIYCLGIVREDDGTRQSAIKQHLHRMRIL